MDGPVFVMACGGSGTSSYLGAVVIPGAGSVVFLVTVDDADHVSLRHHGARCRYRGDALVHLALQPSGVPTPASLPRSN